MINWPRDCSCNLVLAWGTAVLIGNSVLIAQEEPPSHDAEIESRLQTLGEALAAARAQAAEFKTEVERLRSERSRLARELDRVKEQLAAVTWAAAAVEAERQEWIRQAQEDRRRIRELERALEEARTATPPAPPPTAPVSWKELEAALAQRTREVLELRARLADLESIASSRPPPSVPSVGHSSGAADQRIQELTRLFEEEKEIWLSMHRLLNEQRQQAELERDALRQQVRSLEERIAQLEAALTNAHLTAEAFEQALQATQQRPARSRD